VAVWRESMRVVPTLGLRSIATAGQKLDLCVPHKESYDANRIAVGRIWKEKDKKKE
jgi:hypothetical protein